MKDVGGALKEQGGASSDYQQTIRELESIYTILDQLQSTSIMMANPVILNAIKGQAHSLQTILSHFLDQISKYGGPLGCAAPKGFHRGPTSKAKWALLVSKEAAKMKETVTAQSTKLTLLFEMLTT